MAAKGGLGLGLEALFEDNTTESGTASSLRIAEIEPNRSQPRKSFDDDSISALADSIKIHGMLQPILVRPLENGSYQIVAGERRWRAARMLGLSDVPVQIKELTDSEAMQIALIENLQRENLNPVEEAQGYNDLIDEYGMTQEEIASIVGRSRSAIANSMRILNLPSEIQDMLAEGDITTGHAKALMAFDNENIMIDAARKAANGQLTVRALEKMSSDCKKSKADIIADRRIDSYFKEMEISLHESLGRKVKVEYGKNKGALILEFYDKEDLSDLAEKLAK